MTLDSGSELLNQSRVIPQYLFICTPAYLLPSTSSMLVPHFPPRHSSIATVHAFGGVCLAADCRCSGILLVPEVLLTVVVYRYAMQYEAFIDLLLQARFAETSQTHIITDQGQLMWVSRDPLNLRS